MCSLTDYTQTHRHVHSGLFLAESILRNPLKCRPAAVQLFPDGSCRKSEEALLRRSAWRSKSLRDQPRSKEFRERSDSMIVLNVFSEHGAAMHTHTYTPVRFWWVGGGLIQSGMKMKL